jgi:hypothetical protein
VTPDLRQPRKALPARLVLVACLIAPTLVLLTLRSVLPMRGPAKASARNLPLVDPEDKALVELPEPTKGERELARVFAEWEARDIPSSPLAGITSQPVIRVNNLDPRGVALPDWVGVTSIMSARGKLWAIVGNRLHQVGDAVAESWRIKSIDAASGQVVLRHASGAERTLTMRRPGEAK